MLNFQIAGKITSHSTLICIESTGTTSAKTTVRCYDSEKVTVRSYDPDLIYFMLDLQKDEPIQVIGKGSAYAKLSSRNKPYACFVCTAHKIINGKEVLVTKREIPNNHVLFLLYRYILENKVDKHLVSFECEEKFFLTKVESLWKTLWPDKDFSLFKYDNSEAEARVARENELQNQSVAAYLDEKILANQALTEKEKHVLVRANDTTPQPQQLQQQQQQQQQEMEE
ncbi:hypothetical protein BD560DRAFT_429102 [Blakeslea trispora]|nr:hypothetical protein BD560DRAFT_429102 [Blakeslea trispora]